MTLESRKSSIIPSEKIFTKDIENTAYTANLLPLSIKATATRELINEFISSGLYQHLCNTIVVSNITIEKTAAGYTLHSKAIDGYRSLEDPRIRHATILQTAGAEELVAVLCMLGERDPSADDIGIKQISKGSIFCKIDHGESLSKTFKSVEEFFQYAQGIAKIVKPEGFEWQKCFSFLKSWSNDTDNKAEDIIKLKIKELDELGFFQNARLMMQRSAISIPDYALTALGHEVDVDEDSKGVQSLEEAVNSISSYTSSLFDSSGAVMLGGGMSIDALQEFADQHYVSDSEVSISSSDDSDYESDYAIESCDDIDLGVCEDHDNSIIDNELVARYFTHIKSAQELQEYLLQYYNRQKEFFKDMPMERLNCLSKC